MKSANPENEYIPLDLRISVRRDTLRLISEMAQDMGISINEVFSFLAEDSVIDLELLEDLNEKIKFSIFLKLFILPFIIFFICKFSNFNFYQTSALILQAATPTAISTILMAEAYGVKQKIASKILFTTTLISIITIPLLKIFMNLFM